MIADAVPEFRNEVSLQELMEAYIAYKSRSFGGVPDSGGALVPFADSFNHGDGVDKNLSWSYDSN